MLTALAFTAVVAAPVSASAAAPSPASQETPDGSIGVRLVDVPAAVRDDPRARLYIVDHLAPGTVIHRRMEVSNTTASTAHVLLYPAAAGIESGSFRGAAGHTPNDLSTWTSVKPGAADVPDGGTVTATVTIAVPRDAAPGEPYGAVWAEVGSAPAVGGGGVVEVSRVGIRLQLLAGPGGLSAGPFPADVGVTLAIGDTAPVTIALDKQLPAGPWDAQITMRSGLVERSARATITFPDTGSSPPVRTASVHAAGGSWLLPILVAAVALMLLGLFLLVFMVIRRRRHDTPHPDQAE